MKAANDSFAQLPIDNHIGANSNDDSFWFDCMQSANTTCRKSINCHMDIDHTILDTIPKVSFQFAHSIIVPVVLVDAMADSRDGDEPQGSSSTL